MRTYDMRAGEAGEVEHRQPESRMLRPRWVLLFAPIICAMLVSRVRVLMSVVHANKLQFYESCCFLACAVLSSSETTCLLVPIVFYAYGTRQARGNELLTCVPSGS